MENQIRTRFAPSPTGYMHVGNLRTALYAYLFARQNHGRFILRIEDTDKERYIEGAVNKIFDTLKQAGLDWDEGPDVGGDFGPYIQSERQSVYTEYARKLVDEQKAYYCFCDKERLDEVKKLQKASRQPTKYDGHCRNLSENEIERYLKEGRPYVIRQKLPLTGSTSFYDMVYGKVEVQNSDLDDQVLIKSDGMPTYNFANVVDDHLMGITHVIRGSEYLSSTPKYVRLYEAFGWNAPVNIHCPPVMKNSHEKLSKRNKDASFEELVQNGYLPCAIINYIALLGWSPKGEKEIFQMKELIDEFDIRSISKSPAVFDILKLKAINAAHIKSLTDDEFLRISMPYIKKAVSRKIDCKYLVKMLKTRTEILSDIPSQLDFIDELKPYPPSLYTHKKMKTTAQNSLDALKDMLPVLKELDDFSEPTLKEALMKLIEQKQVKNGQIFWPLRVALSGKPFTPGGGVEIAVLLGKDETLSRVKKGIEILQSAS